MWYISAGLMIVWKHGISMFCMSDNHKFKIGMIYISWGWRNLHSMSPSCFHIILCDHIMWYIGLLLYAHSNQKHLKEDKFLKWITPVTYILCITRVNKCRLSSTVRQKFYSRNKLCLLQLLCINQPTYHHITHKPHKVLLLITYNIYKRYHLLLKLTVWHR